MLLRAGSNPTWTVIRSPWVIVSPRGTVRRSATTSWVLAVDDHAHAPSSAPRMTAATDAATNTGRRRSFGAGVTDAWSPSAPLLARRRRSGRVPRPPLTPAESAVSVVRAIGSPSSCSAAQHLGFAHADRGRVGEVQRDRAAQADPYPGDDPVGRGPHRVGALPGVGVPAGRGRLFAVGVGIRRAWPGARDRGAVAHRPDRALRLRGGRDREAPCRRGLRLRPPRRRPRILCPHPRWHPYDPNASRSGLRHDADADGAEVHPRDRLPCQHLRVRRRTVRWRGQPNPEGDPGNRTDTHRSSALVDLAGRAPTPGRVTERRLRLQHLGVALLRLNPPSIRRRAGHHLGRRGQDPRTPWQGDGVDVTTGAPAATAPAIGGGNDDDALPTPRIRTRAWRACDRRVRGERWPCPTKQSNRNR